MNGKTPPPTEEISIVVWIAGALLLAVVSGIIGAVLQSRFSRSSGASSARRPIYWNLIAFALIGAAFSVIAMFLVDDANRSEIAVLYLGLISGYAVSIKELDLAKVDLQRLRIKHGRSGGSQQPVDNDGSQPENAEDQNKESGAV